MMSKKQQQVKIKGKLINLSFPNLNDAKEFISNSKKSVRFHRNLINPILDENTFKQFIKRSESDENRLFLMRRKDDEKLVGVANMSQIFYGSFKNAYLGYYLFRDFTGKGYMTEAIKLVLKYAFKDLKLHRLEANIQPHNSASINLVKRCGFTKEGYSRKYLKIGGQWCDHERWAIIKEDWNNDNKRQ